MPLFELEKYKKIMNSLKIKSGILYKLIKYLIYSEEK